MNSTTIIIGIAVLLFGAYSTVMHLKYPEKIKKLASLKELFGDKTGDRIHFGAYCVLPLAAGAIFIYAGTKGAALF